MTKFPNNDANKNHYQNVLSYIERFQIAGEAVNWCLNNHISIMPLNIITALNAMGCLKRKRIKALIKDDK